jgi:transcriptional regulator with XRE-family HTH domain
MDARTDDVIQTSFADLTVIEERGSASYSLDVAALNRLIDFGREHNPRLKGASDARIAELCEISETTYKSIRKGRNMHPRVDILYSIVALFGGSIDRLVGLAPTRDIARERAVWDGSLVDGMQQHIDLLTAQKAETDAETLRLRAALSASEKAQAKAEERAEYLTQRITEMQTEVTLHRVALRRHRIAMLAIVALLMVLLAVGVIFH